MVIPRCVLVMPTYQSATYINQLFASLTMQSIQIPILIIDSSSTDGSLEKWQDLGVKTHVIPKAEFNHGKTRQLALNLVDADIYIYLTQDAILADTNTLENIISAFNNPEIGCAYGRQLPHEGAGLLGAHLRSFNYPEKSDLRSINDVERLGIKTCANSNSFAAYRKTALVQIGGFPDRVIMGEDIIAAAKMLKAGWKIYYCAESRVFHSHDYSVMQDFKRYFDIGVFHQEEHWILDLFKSPQKLGASYVKSEINFCLKYKKSGMIFISLIHSGMKYLGYHLGRKYKLLPLWLRQKFSMHKFYWDI